MDYRYRFANNQSFNFCVSYFTAFTLSIQTPQLLTILNRKFEQVQLLPNVVSKNIWMISSVDPDETPHLRCLIWVYTVCSGLSDQIHTVM